MNVPRWNIKGFQQRVDKIRKNLNDDVFCILLVTSAQCKIGTEKNPDASMFLNYDTDDLSRGYGQIKEFFTALMKEDILQPYLSDRDLRCWIVRASDVG